MTESFPPGAEVLVTIPCEIDDTGGVRSPKTGRHFRDPTFGRVFTPAEVESHYGGTVTLIPDEPAPYTPREGDEVEVTVRGRLKAPVCAEEGCPCDKKRWIVERDYGDEDMRRMPVEELVWQEGRVRLVQAAPPVYEPGRIYRSESTGSRWLLFPSDGHTPWLSLDAPPHVNMWHAENQLPDDLLLMDLVPAREAS